MLIVLLFCAAVFGNLAADLFRWLAQPTTASTVTVTWGQWQRLRPGDVFGGPAPPDERFDQTYILYSSSKPLVKCVAYSERSSTEMPWRNEFRTDFEPNWTQADRDAVLASCMAHDR